MRPEIKLWMEQALEDFDSAEQNLKIKKFYVSAFLCQQAVEKAMKALFIFKKEESPGKTHSLIFLAKETKVPNVYFRLLQELTPEFVTTRYPDVAGEVPYKLYDESKIKEYLTKSKELLKWIKSQIK